MQQDPKAELLEVFKQFKTDSEIFHDLMRFKVREILLVATVYDAFTLEQDGLLSEKIFGEYYQLNLTSAPRITSVASGGEALDLLEQRQFDMVVVLSRYSRLDSIAAGEIIKEQWPHLPVMLLLNDNLELGTFSQEVGLFRFFDKIFVWNGNSEIFLAMIKFVEDWRNADNDTSIAQVRVILLVEDSIRYYSRYLPHLYSEIIRQTTKLVEEELQDETKKVLKMRCRPKIILASTYEEAMIHYEHFKEFLLCVISDVKFPKDGVLDREAGLKLTTKLKELQPDMPILLQSSEPSIEHKAEELNASFIHKETAFISQKLTNFFYRNLGFGDFVFRNKAKEEIARAKTMSDFRACLKWVPDESIEFHARKNHFSTWLLARGEVQTAKVVSRIHLKDFKDHVGLRDFLINMGNWVYRMKTRGKVISFDRSFLGEPDHICKLSEGSIGGKGRGIAFMNYLLSNSGLAESIPDISIKIPETIIIGVDEFSSFMENNNLVEFVSNNNDYGTIKEKFLECKLCSNTYKRLRILAEELEYPLAVRSSGVLEDSVSHPLSGLYETFFLPNNHPDIEVRIDHIVEAIKLIYASVFSKEATEYFDAINYNIEEEKMAIVIQQVVGKKSGSKFYPHISGVGQSYNYYPFSYIKPQDGVGLLAMGLGRYVVGGERSFRFCPEYPNLEILTPEELVKNSQKKFYVLDLEKNHTDLKNGEDATLLKLDILEAEEDGVLEELTSTWNHLEQRLEVGIYGRGPRVINFANILQYEAFPLAKALKKIMNVACEAMEAPVEIEFAVDLAPEESDKPVFYLLQLKHMIREGDESCINEEKIIDENLFLLSESGMGNGRVDKITDIIWVDPDTFDKAETEEMAKEIAQLNLKMKAENRKYILLGPGRWGTRDRWLGIPVTWPQISCAKVIVEYSLEGFRVDASMGSHFFHNVTSMNIGYFSVAQNSGKSFIDWNWLRNQEVIHEGRYFVHSRAKQDSAIIMDGRKGLFVIYKDVKNSKEVECCEVDISDITASMN